MREPHILTATKTMTIPRRLIYFDSESKVNIAITDEEVSQVESGESVHKEHRPYLICATFKHKTNSGSTQKIRRNYQTIDPITFDDFTFCKDFWTDVDSYAKLREHLYIFAHNAKYDTQVTGGVHYLVRMGYRVKSFSDENPFILEFHREFTHSPSGELYQRIDKKTGELVADPRAKTIFIISSTNYYQQSLATLGKVFGIAKLDFKHDQPFTMEDALIYCDTDVAILEKAMDTFMDFIDRESLGSFKMTVAGQAFAAFRHRFLGAHTIAIHADPEALKTERDAYAGGRTECFKMGKIEGQVYYVDVNSMYPYVMKSHLFPTKLISRWNECSVDRLKELIQEGYLVICDAHIQTEKRIFHKKRKRLIFPVGDYWTTLCTPELIKGINEEAITNVRNICIYEPDNFFESFVDYFYEKRLESKREGDAVHDFLYKIFLNSLYGKFGQKNTRWEQVEEADPEEVEVYYAFDADTNKRTIFKVFGGWVWKRNDDGDDEEAFNSFPAVAAHVTAYARMLLWDAIECAGIENVYYSDTDSIMCNLIGYQRLEKAGYMNESILGKLKLEKTGELELFGCKDYVFNDMTKIKGVSKNARVLDPTADGKLRFAVTQWGGFTDRLKNKDFSTYANKIIIKQLKRDYNKGIVQGSNVLPFRLHEAEDIKKEYQDYLIESVNDLFVKDSLKHICRTYGYIQTLQPGDKYYAEYKQLKRSHKMNYFRRVGIALDIWCEDTGYSLGELFEELNNK